MNEEDQVSDKEHQNMVQKFLNNRNAMVTIAWGDDFVIPMENSVKEVKPSLRTKVIEPYVYRPTVSEIRHYCENDLFFSRLRRKDSASYRYRVEMFKYYSLVVFMCCLAIFLFICVAWGLYILITP